MNEIEIAELLKIAPSDRFVVDIRPSETYSRGTIEGAINIPLPSIPGWMNELKVNGENRINGRKRIGENRMSEAGKTIYVLCHTGDQSRDVVDELEVAGFAAVNVKGGYRAFLKYQLSKLMEAQDAENAQQEEREKIERSLIKKFRKQIWRKFTKGINEYDLIQDGDKIAVCISGGKDSMLMAKLFQELQRHGRANFELVFLTMNPGYNEENWRIIQDNAKLLGIPLTVFETEIFDTVATIDKNPCYLCARMRRGYLYSHAKELGCNKIALGHHFDDVIETILMGMFYGGKVETMMPKLHSKNFEGMELIRPMYLIREEDIKAWRDYNRLMFIQCACRFTENCASCGGGQSSKREEMKELIAQLREKSEFIEMNIFRSVENVNLKTIIGYTKDGEKYHFLDDYDQRS
ncbi:MAG: ATPase [Clostridiales bacterium]|nr:ATPase [Clostridiales bacterium]